jgi:dTMP kinase
MPMAKPLFITFEGGEGAGKTTQIKRLSARLISEGYNVRVTREPGGSIEANALWKVFTDNNGQSWDEIAQAFLVFTTRKLHTEDLIKPSLEAGMVVISDRYTDSTRVYQGIAGGVGMETIEELKTICIGDFEPDLTFVFDIDPQVGLNRVKGQKRQNPDTFEKKNIAFHQNIRKGYLEIASIYKDRCRVIDAACDMDSVERNIWEECLKSLS